MSRPILVVEDDLGIREMLVDCLSDAGYATVTAVNGVAALALLEAGLEPSLIMLDLAMPLMGGKEFLQAWRAEWPAAPTPVLILTADQREHAYAATMGVSCVVTKPMEIEVLLAAVERCLAPARQPGALLDPSIRMAEQQPTEAC